MENNLQNIKRLIYYTAFIVVFYINLVVIKEQSYSHIFLLYIVSAMFYCLFIVIIILDFYTEKKIKSFSREINRLELSILDLDLESSLFHSIMRIVELFIKDIPFEKILVILTDEVKNFFPKDTISIHLFEEHFININNGLSIQIPVEFFDEIVMGSGSFLINNISSFPKYNFLEKQGIKSFIITPLLKKQEPVGIFGVFSTEGKKYTQKQLEILSMIMQVVSLVIENAELAEKTKILINIDMLTQVYNRRYFQESFKEFEKKAMEDNLPVSLAMIDIDFFKAYNDRNGHLAGDIILKEICSIFKKNTKGQDVVARYGGEEFVIIFPNTMKANAKKICEHLRKLVEKTHFPSEEFQPNKDLTISIGVASYPEDTKVFKDILQKADVALYNAKKEGRNKVVLSS